MLGCGAQVDDAADVVGGGQRFPGGFGGVVLRPLQSALREMQSQSLVRIMGRAFRLIEKCLAIEGLVGQKEGYGDLHTGRALR